MKTKLLFAFACIMLNASFCLAQKVDVKYLAPQTYKLPENKSYVNYKTYNLYITYPDSDFKVDGVCNTPMGLGLTFAENGDFKIIAEVVSTTKNSMNSKGDSTVIRSEAINFTIHAYDKAGVNFYTKNINTGIYSATIQGKSSGKGDMEFQSKLMRALIEKALPTVLKEFRENYLVYASPITTFTGHAAVSVASLFAFKLKGTADDVYEKVKTVIDITNQDLRIEEIKNQLGFWESLLELEDNKDNASFIFCGLYNLALFHYLLGDQVKSDEYFAKAQLRNDGRNEKYIIKDFIGFKEKRAPTAEVFLKPDLSTFNTLHAENLTSSMTMGKAVENYKYFILSGQITMNDGSLMEGTCFISKRKPNTSSGGIFSLDKSSGYPVIIEATDGSKTNTSLEKIDKIVSDQIIYTCSPQSILKSEYSSEKISLYRFIFPEEGEYRYQKGTGKLDAPGIFSSTIKWLAKFFGDCPELSQKITDKVIPTTEALQMVKTYNEDCK